MRYIALVALTLILVGCGTEPPPSMAELTSGAGCTGVETTTQMMTREAAYCEVEGTEVTLVTFTDNSQRDQWLAFPLWGGGVLITGNQWAAQVMGTEAQAEALAGTLHGDVQ